MTENVPIATDDTVAAREAPLTSAQARMVFWEDLAPGTALYNTGGILSIDGSLDPEVLAASILDVTTRHEVLRSRVGTRDGELLQRILPQAVCPMAIKDLADRESRRVEEDFERLVDEELRRPFDLRKDPGMRTTLVRFSPQHHRLVCTFHHSIVDGLSIGILLMDLCELYASRVESREARLLPIPLGYADFILSERDLLDKGVREKELKYWSRQLAGAAAASGMPTDHPRPPAPRFRGASVPIDLSAEATEAVLAMAARTQMTPFMVLLAAWQLLLHRCSGQRTVVVGSPIANRRGRESRNLVGFLGNTIALRADITPDLSVAEFLSQVQVMARAAYAHSNLPFEEVVDALTPHRDPNRVPLLHAMIVLDPEPPKPVELAGLRISLKRVDLPVARLDLALLLGFDDGRIRGTIAFDADLFSRATVERMAAHFADTLEGLAGAPDANAATLQLREKPVRDAGTSGPIAAGLDANRPSVHAQVFERAANDPGAVAVVCGDQRLTYGELAQRSRALAGRLRSLGVEPEARVAVCVERSTDLIVALLGTLAAGGAYVPLELDTPTPRLEVLLKDCAPLVMLARADARSRIPRGPWAVLPLDELALQISETGPAPLDDSPLGDQLAYVIYTSGSTGRPKGVMVTHANLAASTAAREHYYGATPARLLAAASFTFDAATGAVWWTLCGGGTVVLTGPTAAEDLREMGHLIAREQVTHIVAVATVYGAVIRQVAPGTLDSLEAAIVGGEPLAGGVVDDHYRLLPKTSLYNEYGLTEATVWSAVHKVDPSDSAGPVPIGMPAPHARLHIVDAALHPVPDGIVGELVIGGCGVARGYLNLAETSAEAFIPSPFEPGERVYRTGDIVRRCADGNLVFLGRHDEQVKIRGLRIELGEIEHALRALPGVARAAVAVHESATGLPVLVAYVQPDPSAHPSMDTLRDLLRKQLPAAMVPTVWLPVGRVPALASGKIDRASLPAPQWGEHRNPEVAPRDATENSIWKIWCEVLKAEGIDIHANFFDLGGHSLLATQVVSRLRETLDVDLPLRTLFESPTIAGLAGKVAELKNAEHRASVILPIEALSRDGPLPLSFSQRRMWYMQQLDPRSTAYNMPFAVRLKGRLDRVALSGALQAVADRHEAFRTSFAVEHGEPMQRIAPSVTIPVREIDLRSLTPEAAAAESREILRRESMIPFDLAITGLFRFLLVRLSETEHLVFWLVHHVVCDQWSAGIVSRDFASAYRALTRGASPVFVPLPIQYADYAAWQRQHLDDEALAAHVTYWRRRLNRLSVLALPTDFARPPRLTYLGSHVTASIPAATLKSLKFVSAEAGVTPFMFLLACFKVLLSRYCNQDDIVVGVPIANRTRVATEDLVGTLVNTLVMRTSLEDDPTFDELLARIRDTALEAYAHQDLPFERLVEELATKRDEAASPLVQVLFNVPNAPVSDLDLDGLEFDTFDFDHGSAQFDLSMTVDTEIFGRVYLGYSTELFSQATAEGILTRYLGLLEQFVTDSTRCLSSYRIVTDAEWTRVVHDWNHTESDYPREQRVDQLVSAQASRVPERNAVCMGDQCLTYADLERQSTRLAHYLRRRHVRNGSLVGVCLERSPDLLVALLAVMKSGAAYVPLDPAFPAERLSAMVDDAGLALILTERALLPLLAPYSSMTVCLDEARTLLETEPVCALDTGSATDDLAYVIYTSGSTGTPKGVEVGHRALTNFLWSMRLAPGCSERDTLLAVTTLSFDIAGLELYLPLVVGGRVDLASSREAADGRLLLDRMEKSRPTIMQATPATWHMLIDGGWAGSPALKVLCGGEGLPRDLADRLLDRGTQLWNLFGPTETTIWSTVERVERGTGPVAIGRPIANTTIYILDQAMQPVPVGVPGELWIGGHGLARGYRRREGLTAERFLPGSHSGLPADRIYRTGDLARYLPDGRIEHLGRLDFQVKIRGYRIELGEIEAALTQAEGVRQVVVTARDDEHGLKQLVAYVIPDGRTRPEASALRDFLRVKLPEYMVPGHFVFVDEMPLTANRKIDVRALPPPNADKAKSEERPVKPRGRLEVQLMALWRQVLGDATIGVHDNFFDHGGHSLKAVQLLSYVEQVTGRQLPLATLYEAPSVARMARLLKAAHWKPSWRSLVAIQPGGRMVPVFAVPGVNGNVLMFAGLSKLLGPDQPFYGLQARGLDANETPLTTMPEIATHYISEIRSIRPTGPYVLLGACTGGVIAYEMAQQLKAAGEDVVLMVLEAWHPSTARTAQNKGPGIWPLRFTLRRLLAYLMPHAPRPASHLPGKLLARLQNLATPDDLDSDDRPMDGDLHSERVAQATWLAVIDYDPRPYPGHLLNVIAAARTVPERVVDTRTRWQDLAEGGYQCDSLPADDSGRIFVSPHVESLANKLRDYISQRLVTSVLRDEIEPAGHA